MCVCVYVFGGVWLYMGVVIRVCVCVGVFVCVFMYVVVCEWGVGMCVYSPCDPGLFSIK